MLRQFFLAVALSIVGLTAAAQAAGACATDPTNITTCNYAITDDGYAIVPIPFGFPYYGKLFTHSIFFDNGLVSFYTPDQEPQRLGGQNYYAEPLSNNINSQFYYSIMPLWSDLRNYNGRYFTETDGVGFLRYNWENISQYGYPDRLNTFSAEIRPSGYIGINYQLINITGYPITSGLVGNASLGEWTQIYHKPPADSATIGSIQNWSVSETAATDCSNPLNNVNCPGYSQAYFDQQCSINPLYSPSCAGYSQAYFDQQCSINPLYDPACPGYAVAYYDYQCGIDPLYHTGCPGYSQAYFDQQCSLDPLYNEACPGYATAYFDQQCSLDPLYNESCLGYDDAYYVQQCTADPLYDSGCTGYEVAYFDQQCTLNALYNSQCPGYEVAYFDQQCANDALYNNQCPGYEVAYFDQQCANDALYNNQCPGYGEAYAKKYILSEEPVVVATADTTEPVVANVTEPTKETTAVVVAAETPAASAGPADKTSPVQLTAAPAAAPATETKKEAAPARTEARPAASATRQALAERRMAARAAAAAEKANSGEMSSEMDSADSMEQQAELQNVVMGAMGFVAGFDAYGRATIPDAAGYKPFVIYPGQQNIDTPAGRRLLTGSDRLHQDMVDSQYNK
jgi:hypothetical protein